ncbi:MAG TPA: pyridoxamine 5'-phosphate oxidase family protein [Acidimicrobiia bacterium]|nr:pyridoxamine 5'-phosphate oxidase family protein [Acidimicrobiia bacterium]
MESLSRDEALEILASEYVAHLGVISNGAPYVTPMSFVLDGDRILFRTMAGRKLDAIRANPTVCIEVSRYHEETGDWESVIVEGEARLVEEDETRRTTVALIFDKYEQVMGSPLSGGGGLMPLGGYPQVIEVPIDDIVGMSSGRGMSARTKPGRM